MELGYNTLLVLSSVVALGIANGIIGVYIMLYKKALVSDAVSHAALPGIALGYFIADYMGLDITKSFPLLLMCAAVSGYSAIYCIEYLLHHTRLKEDAAIAINLSVYFAIGIVLFSIIQSLDNGSNRSGIDSFLLGQTSGISKNEATFIIISSIAFVLLALSHHKHLLFQSFDFITSKHLNPAHQRTKRLLPILMMGVICIGLKTTGAILVLALLIIPAATARLCSHKNVAIIIISAITGASCAAIGTLLSASELNSPAGSTITAILFFVFMTIFFIYLLFKSGRLKNG